MATVYKKTYTKPLPVGAETFTRKGQCFARWKPAKGKTRIEKVTTGQDGSERIIVEAVTYTAKYRNGAGQVVEKATGCGDEAAARAVLAELVKRSEYVRSGIITPTQEAVADHQGTSLTEHIEAYLTHLAAKGVSERHRYNVERNLRRVTLECRFARLAHFQGASVEKWLAERESEGMGARTRNTYRAAVVAFGHWCVETDRLSVNPFARLPKAAEKTDCRRQRRALTEDELVRLLDAARRRPLLEAMTIRTGGRRGRAVAEVRPVVERKLERLGQERALVYKTLALTGLRKGELASLTVGQLDLDGEMPCAMLRAADEKNGRGSSIPLRGDVAADLRQWLSDKLEAVREYCRASGEPIPARLDFDTPLFTVPAALNRILDRDLALAKIPKRDQRGRTVDVHALRHTFGTHLSKGGVAPRTAQAAMRHCSIDLTMNTYTDPELLDVRSALDALPELPLTGREEGARERATGTDGAGALAPTLAPKSGHSSISEAIAGKRRLRRGQGAEGLWMAQEAATGAFGGQDGHEGLERARGFEPPTFSLGS